MAAKQQTKTTTRRRKFVKVHIPLTNTTIELMGDTPETVSGRTTKLDLTRELRGKSIEATVQITIEEGKAVAHPKKLRLMPYFIRRMIRKRISYVEDAFDVPSQNSLIRIKPFLITRKRVSRAVRSALRNKTKNWIEDFIKERTDKEIVNKMLTNTLQKQLSLSLKKTYPLSLCEIRMLEIKRPLKPEEVPKIEKKKALEKKKTDEPFIDQLAEIEQEKLKKAQEEIKETQKKAIEKEKAEKGDTKAMKKATKKVVKKTTKKTTKKAVKKDE